MDARWSASQIPAAAALLVELLVQSGGGGARGQHDASLGVADQVVDDASRLGARVEDVRAGAAARVGWWKCPRTARCQAAEPQGACPVGRRPRAASSAAEDRARPGQSRRAASPWLTCRPRGPPSSPHSSAWRLHTARPGPRVQAPLWRTCRPRGSPSSAWKAHSRRTRRMKPSGRPTNWAPRPCCRRSPPPSGRPGQQRLPPSGRPVQERLTMPAVVRRRGAQEGRGGPWCSPPPVPRPSWKAPRATQVHSPQGHAPIAAGPPRRRRHRARRARRGPAAASRSRSPWAQPLRRHRCRRDRTAWKAPASPTKLPGTTELPPRTAPPRPAWTQSCWSS